MDSHQAPPAELDEVKSLKSQVTKFLSTVERFNVDNLPVFEKYVESQVVDNFYDRDANLAVLKLYQLFPQFYRHDVVHQILSKALTNLPHNDFDLCRCLLGGEQFGDLAIQRLCYFANLLETCQFQAFWKEMEKDPGVFYGISGFEDCIRTFISQMVSIMYKNMTEIELKNILGNIDDHKLEKWMQIFRWEKGLDGVVKILDQEDRVTDKDIAEKFNLESVSKLINVTERTDVICISSDKTAGFEMSSQPNHTKAFPSKVVSMQSSSSLSVDNEVFLKNQNFDPNHDPDDYEVITTDLSRNPSKETEFDWIYLDNKLPNNSKHSKGDDIVTGKWLVFEPLDKIDETWSKISTAVANGVLGCAAKVSTIKDIEVRSPYIDQGVICVYTYDHNDEYDVMRVRGALRRMGFTRKLPYKTDVATLAGEYRWKTGKRVSKYYL